MTTDQRIIAVDEMAQLAESHRRAGRQVVLCHGVFDLLHPGHMRHLARAREEGDLLFVTLTADRFVSKGPGRPVFNQALRAESLAAIGCVDAVAVVEHATAIPVLESVRPAIYVKGQDYRKAGEDLTGNIALERQAVEQGGGRILFTDEIQFSSTHLLNDHFDLFPPATKDFLDDFKSRHSARAIIDDIAALKKLKVLIIGEAIVDEYCYADPLGLTGKTGILAVRHREVERFAGGALAIANHLGGFLKRVTLLSGLGSDKRYEPFIQSRLAENIEPVFFHFEEAPTLVKRRFVDAAMNKLFEVYEYDDEPLTPAVEQRILHWIDHHVADYDMVIVPDYGNGFISPAMVDAICDKARFLAVNTQINSGNRGYHAITRYHRADFISLNEPEVRLAAHNRHDAIERVAEGVARDIGANHMAITRAMHGAKLLDNAASSSLGKWYDVPALSTRVVDRIGAGDAFLALAGLALTGGINPEVALFVGSAAAALDVQIVCNREPVSSVALNKYITTLLK